MYQPSEDTLQKYADLLIKFALGGGEGVKEDDVVWLSIPESAKAFIPATRRSVLTSGAHLMINYHPDDVRSREFYDLASQKQLSFFADKYYRGMVDQIDHIVFIQSEYDKYEMKGVDSAKMMARQKAHKPYMDWREEKERQGKFTWTIGGFATEAMAKDVGMTLEEYWEQIILSCYLDLEDPIKKWKEIFTEQERLKKELNDLQIQKVHVEAENIDLWVRLGSDRKWLGGGGRNMPSFELFISPDWRGTNGHIYFNQPLYSHGNKITDIKLKFQDGVVTEATASENEKLIQDMVAVENADKIGEFSLTDSRMSRITKVMGDTLYDENMGGEQGNTHLAIGLAYKDSYAGDASGVADKEWEEMGFNDSAVHTDMISTERRQVTATLPDGSQKVIYQDGQFKV